MLNSWWISFTLNFQVTESSRWSKSVKPRIASVYKNLFIVPWFFILNWEKKVTIHSYWIDKLSTDILLNYPNWMILIKLNLVRIGANIRIIVDLGAEVKIAWFMKKKRGNSIARHSIITTNCKMDYILPWATMTKRTIQGFDNQVKLNWKFFAPIDKLSSQPFIIFENWNCSFGAVIIFEIFWWIWNE